MVLGIYIAKKSQAPYGDCSLRSVGVCAQEAFASVLDTDKATDTRPSISRPSGYTGIPCGRRLEMCMKT